MHTLSTVVGAASDRQLALMNFSIEAGILLRGNGEMLHSMHEIISSSPAVMQFFSNFLVVVYISQYMIIRKQPQNSIIIGIFSCKHVMYYSIWNSEAVSL